VTRRPERVEFDRAQRELRALFNRLDPMGLILDPELQEDEYDCLIAPLYGRLVAGAPEAQLRAYVAEQRAHHFEDREPRPEADAELVDELLSWWRTRNTP